MTEYLPQTRRERCRGAFVLLLDVAADKLASQNAIEAHNAVRQMSDEVNCERSFWRFGFQRAIRRDRN